MTEQERNDIINTVMAAMAAAGGQTPQQQAPVQPQQPLVQQPAIDPNAIISTVMSQLSPLLQQQALQQTMLQQQQLQQLGPLAGLDVQQLLNMGEPMKSALLQYIAQSQGIGDTNSQIQEINRRLDMMQYQAAYRHHHHHKTAKIVGATALAAGVGGAVYLHHRHSKKKEAEFYDRAFNLIETKLNNK